MLDERELVGAKVIRDLEALALDCIEVDKYDFFTAALYLIAVRCVDWEASKWIGECLEHDSYNEKKDNLVLSIEKRLDHKHIQFVLLKRKKSVNFIIECLSVFNVNALIILAL